MTLLTATSSHLLNHPSSIRIAGSPDWAALYPVKASSGAFDPLNDKTVYAELSTRSQLLSPRMACKLFHDGLLLIKRGEEAPKYIQDRIPEVAHKCFKASPSPPLLCFAFLSFLRLLPFTASITSSTPAPTNCPNPFPSPPPYRY